MNLYLCITNPEKNVWLPCNEKTIRRLNWTLFNDDTVNYFKHTNVSKQNKGIKALVRLCFISLQIRQKD